MEDQLISDLLRAYNGKNAAILILLNLCLDELKSTEPIPPGELKDRAENRIALCDALSLAIREIELEQRSHGNYATH
jgi:hypothetical protein